MSAQSQANLQERLFDYEIIQRFVELEDANDSMLHDFVFWLHFSNRDALEAKWAKYQKFIGASAS